MNDTEDTKESSKVQENEGNPIQGESTVKADAAAVEGNEVKKDEPKKGKEAKEEEKRSQKELDNCRKELENALKELEDVKKKSAETNDKYLRMVAEFDNYRRRTSKERLELVATAGEEVIKGILPVLDDFEHALKLLGETNSSQECIDGTQLIYKKLVDYLKTKGVAEIKAVGETFDTDYHEAVAQIPAPDPKQKNTVVEVIQKGYTLNGKIIRYAKVVIGI